MFKRRKLFSIESGSARQGEKLGNAKAFFRLGTAFAIAGGIGVGVLMAVPALIVGLVGGPGLTLFAGTVTAASVWCGMSRGLTHLFGWGFDKLTNIEDVLSLDKTLMIDLRSPSERTREGIDESVLNVDEVTFKDSQRRNIIFDGDPKRYMTTIGIRAGVGIVLLNHPSQDLLKDLNAGLVTMLNTDRRSDYVSQAIKGGYLINIKTSAQGFLLILKQALRGGRKVNCIKTETLNNYINGNIQN